jgi:hypothetical protein
MFGATDDYIGGSNRIKRSVFGRYRRGHSWRWLPYLQPKCIFTTNYDELIELGYRTLAVQDRRVDVVAVEANRVSGDKTRILKIGDQRLAREIGRWRRKIHKITRQRLRDVSLTLGNVARIFANRT